MPLSKKLKYKIKKNYSANGTVGTSFSLILFIISDSIKESLLNELPDIIANDKLVTINPAAKKRVNFEIKPVVDWEDIMLDIPPPRPPNPPSLLWSKTDMTKLIATIIWIVNTIDAIYQLKLYITFYKKIKHIIYMIKLKKM